jgi:hypothetical protein
MPVNAGIFNLSQIIIVENTELPKDIRIILLDKPDRSHYNALFKNSVPFKTVVPEVAEPLLEEAKSNSAAAVEIDLFHSLSWQQHLIGSWRLVPKVGGDHAFAWQPGKLLRYLLQEKQPSSITFKNPPLNDKSFTNFITELQALKKIQWADQEKVLARLPPLHQQEGYDWEGYDWEGLSQQASLHFFTGQENKPPQVLSDASLPAFVEKMGVQFSKDTDLLEMKPGHLRVANVKHIDVMCAPGLSTGALAEFLTRAQKQSIHVRFFTYAQFSPLKNGC